MLRLINAPTSLETENGQLHELPGATCAKTNHSGYQPWCRNQPKKDLTLQHPLSQRQPMAAGLFGHVFPEHFDDPLQHEAFPRAGFAFKQPGFHQSVVLRVWADVGSERFHGNCCTVVGLGITPGAYF